MKRKTFESSTIIAPVVRVRPLIWKEAKQQSKIRPPEADRADAPASFAGLVDEQPTERERELVRLCERSKVRITELQGTVALLSKRIEELSKINTVLQQSQQQTLGELAETHRKLRALSPVQSVVLSSPQNDPWSVVYDELELC